MPDSLKLTGPDGLMRGETEPVYVSETVERTMNPTFRHVDWSACGPGITRMEHLTLRFWARSKKFGQWRQLLELALDLRSLQYLGRSVRSITLMAVK